jgi:hypothetical protein
VNAGPKGVPETNFHFVYKIGLPSGNRENIHWHLSIGAFSIVVKTA